MQASALTVHIPRAGHSQQMQEQQLTSQATEQVVVIAGAYRDGHDLSMRLSTVRIV